MPFHSAFLTIDQWSAHCVAFWFLPLTVTSNRSTASCTRTTGISGTYPTGENTSIVGFVLCVVENASFHPIGAFLIPSFAVLALCWLEVAKMLKNHDACLMLLGKLDNAGTYQMSHMLVYVSHLLPRIHIVLFVLCNVASLFAIACDTSELFLPKSGYPLSTPNEKGGKSRTFTSSNGTDR